MDVSKLSTTSGLTTNKDLVLKLQKVLMDEAEWIGFRCGKEKSSQKLQKGHTYLNKPAAFSFV